MGKSMYDYGNHGKERARQLLQIDKAAKRIQDKQRKVNINAGTPTGESDPADAGSLEETGKATA